MSDEVRAAGLQGADLEREIATLQAELALLKRGPLPPRPPPAEARRAASKGGRCAHKVATDHHAGRDADGRVVWRCSHCGARDCWQPGWRYSGNLECPRCGWAQIDDVWCPVCAATHDPHDRHDPREE